MLRQSVARQFLRGRPNVSGPIVSGPIVSGPIGSARADLPQQGVLILDAEMAVAGGTVSIDKWLRLLQPGPRPLQGVPAEVLNVAAQLLARESGVDDHPASARVHIGAGRWAALRASRMDPTGPGAVPPLAVTIQACTPEARLDIFA